MSETRCFELIVSECPSCHRLMMPYVSHKAWPDNREAQKQLHNLIEAGQYSYRYQDYICEDCVKSATVVCYLCKQERANDEIRTQWGDRCLCERCFETVTAKVWDEAEREAAAIAYPD